MLYEKSVNASSPSEKSLLPRFSGITFSSGLALSERSIGPLRQRRDVPRH